MNDKHIIEILDKVPLAKLSESEMTRISTHSQVCVACRNAFEAAQLSTLVIKERTQLTIEPPAFFQTRVLAALRERQTTESVPAFGRLWKAAGALVSSMAVTTAALAVLSFVVPSSVTTGADDTAYSAESIILDQGSDEPLTYEQVLSTIYAEEDEAR
jgi:hypothetical protein